MSQKIVWKCKYRKALKTFPKTKFTFLEAQVSPFILIDFRSWHANDKQRQKSAVSAAFLRKGYKVIRSPERKRGKMGIMGKRMPNCPANNPNAHRKSHHDEWNINRYEMYCKNPSIRNIKRYKNYALWFQLKRIFRFQTAYVPISLSFHEIEKILPIGFEFPANFSKVTKNVNRLNIAIFSRYFIKSEKTKAGNSKSALLSSDRVWSNLALISRDFGWIIFSENDRV